MAVENLKRCFNGYFEKTEILRIFLNKTKFYSKIQNSNDSIPRTDVLILLSTDYGHRNS